MLLHGNHAYIGGICCIGGISGIGGIGGIGDNHFLILCILMTSISHSLSREATKVNIGPIVGNQPEPKQIPLGLETNTNSNHIQPSQRTSVSKMLTEAKFWKTNTCRRNTNHILKWVSLVSGLCK